MLFILTDVSDTKSEKKTQFSSLTVPRRRYLVIYSISIYLVVFGLTITMLTVKLTIIHIT